MRDRLLLPATLVDLVIHFSGSRPTAAELVAVRKVDPALRDKPLHEVKAIIGTHRSWRMGPVSPYELRATEKLCGKLGLRIQRFIEPPLQYHRDSRDLDRR